MPLATYSAAQVTVVVGTQVITGAAAEDFVAVEYNEDRVVLTIGAQGDAARSLQQNHSATITLTLMANSPSNDYLSDLLLADIATGGGVVPILIKDSGVGNAEGSKGTLFGAATAWVKKPPGATFGKELGTREWVFETDKLIPYYGGYQLPA